MGRVRARIRTVKPEMRQDERYARLSYPARELFNGLITMADDEGRFRALTSAILGHVFPYDDDAPRKLRDWVGEVRDSGMVLFYVVDGVPYGAFRHWRRHQKINRPNPSDLPPPPDHDVIRENSVNEHGSFTDESVKDHGSFTPSRAGARSDPDPEVVVRLSERLANHVRANDPKADPQPTSERWLTDMRLLLADRAGDVAEVERIVDWCQQDDFWRSNVLSPGKLRKQFTQLMLASKRRGERRSPGLRLIDAQTKENNRLGRERRERRLAEMQAEYDEHDAQFTKSEETA